jgi:Thoeris protein ThsB, TIR-like domain
MQMSTRQIHVFISHAWSYSGHYQSLAEWIFDERWSVGQASLDFRDYSIPRSDPIHNAPSDRALKDAIFSKISRSHVVVIPTGMYVNYSKWIQKEIDGAEQYGKPILGVNPWGQLRKSSVVAAAAHKVVGWNKQPLINAIWELYKELMAA